MKPDRPVAPLAGTLVACTTVLLAFMSALFALTGTFEHWTFEDKRRDDAKQGRLVAPTIAVRTAQGTPQTLWAKRADGDEAELHQHLAEVRPMPSDVTHLEFAK